MGKSNNSNGEGSFDPWESANKIEWHDKYALDDNLVAGAKRITSGDSKPVTEIYVGSVTSGGSKKVFEVEGATASKVAYKTFINTMEALLSEKCTAHTPRGSRHADLFMKDGSKKWAAGPSVGVTDGLGVGCDGFPYSVHILGYEDFDNAIKAIAMKLFDEEEPEGEALDALKEILGEGDLGPIGCKNLTDANQLVEDFEEYGVKSEVKKAHPSDHKDTGSDSDDAFMDGSDDSEEIF